MLTSLLTAQGVTVTRDPDEFSTDLGKNVTALSKHEATTKTPHQLVVVGGLSGRLDQTVHTLHALWILAEKEGREKVWVVGKESAAMILRKVRRSPLLSLRPVFTRRGRKCFTRLITNALALTGHTQPLHRPLLLRQNLRRPSPRCLRSLRDNNRTRMGSRTYSMYVSSVPSFPSVVLTLPPSCSPMTPRHVPYLPCDCSIDEQPSRTGECDGRDGRSGGMDDGG
jgi:hypothetical protein